MTTIDFALQRPVKNASQTPPASGSSDPRWTAVAARDRGADGTFVYAVRTTGVYCRPSCAARRPNPVNVRFYGTPAEAEAAGYRPCRRCRPRTPSGPPRHAAAIAAACRLLERDDTPPLATLAAQAGLSPHHFHRLFRSITGLTPRAYAAARRAERVRTALQDGGGTVTDAVYAAGYGSGGRFYETAGANLGMTPSAYRAGGPRETIKFAVGECSLGSILVAQTAKGVCAILLGDDPDALVHDLERRFPRASLVGGDPEFDAVISTIVGFVEDPAAVLDLPLDIRGTAFQQRVWRALTRVRPGERLTYAALARRVGAPAAVRAVAGACGANPLAIAIPCHRVVRTDGALSGYRWGVERKRALLAREAAALKG